MPPSPTIISPAFNRSRMVPFYERSEEITPNWILFPILRTDEKGDSERSDEKRNAFFILLYFFRVTHLQRVPFSVLASRLPPLAWKMHKKKKLSHLPLPHHFSNVSSLCGHSNPFRGEIESMFWRPRREPLGRSGGILLPPWKFLSGVISWHHFFMVFYAVFLSQISLSFSLLLLIHLFRIKKRDFFYQTLYNGKVL